MGFDRTMPPPVFGVSTVPPAARGEGFCTQQTNWRNDAQDKLTRRPPFRAEPYGWQVWPFTPETVETYTSYRNGQRLEVVVGVTHTYNTMAIQYRQGLGQFNILQRGLEPGWCNGVAPRLGIRDIDGFIYVWNKDMVWDTIGIGTDQERHYKHCSVINITSALNYAERVQINVLQNGVISHSVVYEVPGLTSDNQADADRKRATNYVAQQLADLLDDSIALEVSWRGSNIHVVAPYFTENDELTLEVSTGRGDSAIVIKNYKSSDIEGLPKYSIPGTVRAIVPDPSSKNGRYWLKAEAVGKPTNSICEVVWAETYEPKTRLGFSIDKYMIKMGLDGTVDQFRFKPRDVGNDDSNPPRDFIGRTIEEMDSFQDRLAILSGSRLNLSKTDDFQQIWKNSALELLVTDPTDVGTSGNTSRLRKMKFHNRDLLIFAEDAQFKMKGDVAVTPQTAAMPITTVNECNLDVDPVQMGSYVYYSNDYGGSAGIRRFEVEADTIVDRSVSVTDHIIGFMPGALTDLVSNANQDMLICRSSGGKSNQLFIFEKQLYGENEVFSWCDWMLPEGINVEHIDLYNELLVVRYDGGRYMSMELKSDATWPERDICLDIWQLGVVLDGKLRIPTSSLIVPDAELVEILEMSGRSTLLQVDFEYNGVVGFMHEFSVDNDFDGKALAVGLKYESLYELTRPYERDRDGNIRTTDRLRISHYLLELSNTYRLTRRIVAEHWDLPDEVFTSLDANRQEFIDEVKPYTGQWQSQIGMNADDCTVQYLTDSPYDATIVAMAVHGQQYSTRNRR